LIFFFFIFKNNFQLYHLSCLFFFLFYEIGAKLNGEDRHAEVVDLFIQAARSGSQGNIDADVQV